MAKRNIFSMLNHPTNNIGRNGFDLSHRKVFSAKAGELLPILCEDVLPGDYFEIDTASLVRTLPLNTAAFLRARCCFDFFFVPKTKLWSNYNAFISQRNVVESSALNGSAYEPNITFSTLNAYVTEALQFDDVKDSAYARAKLLQLLGYGDGMLTLPSGLDATKSLTALPIAGYNAIYNWYYRNSWRDEPNQNAIYQSNLDFLTCETYANSLVTTGDVSDFVQMRYHGWFKDLFMGSLPNQQFGVVSSINLQNVTISNATTDAVDNTIRASVGTDSSKLLNLRNTSNVSLQNSHFWNLNNAFDVLALRKALALQKWKEYNMRAGWKSKYQQRAMFGVDAPHDSQHEIDFIDSHEQIIQISEVISTANTSSPESGNGNLAEIAGKGISADAGRKIKYSVNQPGYIYCIFYVMPDTEYDADMIDRQLVRSEPFDHYTPAFENLGMQAIHKSELNYTGNPSYFNSVLGYAPNYYEYKTRIDKVYGTFKTGQSLSPWVSVRRDLQNIINSGEIPVSYFYVNPSVLDSIFTVNADGLLDTDQFIVNCNFDIKAVRPMSVLGLPTL